MGNLELKDGLPESVGMDPGRIEGLRKLAASWVETGDTPSVSVLVARRGVIVLHEAFGVRRPEDATPTLRRDSIFPLASCTKPLTAAAVMCLVEDGLIGLNRPFIDYIPELEVAGVKWLEEASVADLLCHTSGLEDVEIGAFINAAAGKSPALTAPGPGQHPALARRIQLAAGVPLARRPGSTMLYSNFGYTLLGDIVRRVSGQPFWRFVRSRLFEPLGMNDSFFVLPPEQQERRVYRAQGMPGTQPVPGLHGGSNSAEFDELDMGNTGAASTTRDLAVFMQMLLNGGSYGGRRVLSPATVAAMTRHQVDTAIPWLMVLIRPDTGQRWEYEYHGGGYGYGLFIFGPGDRFILNGALASPSAFGHAGYGSAYMWADPERDVVGVFLGVAPRLSRGAPLIPADLFLNAVYGAVVE